MKMMRTLMVLFVAAAALPARSVAQSAPSPADVVLRPGDAVRITVWRRPDLSGEFQVAADGSIADPSYLGVRVTDMSLAAAEEGVRRYVLQYQENPRVLVQPLFRVGVGGEVRQPSLYLMRPDFSIMQAVMQAGGPTDQARMNAVAVFRNGRKVMLDLSNPDVQSRETLHSGDQIIVGRKSSVLRDVIGPAASLIGAMASIVLIARQR